MVALVLADHMLRSGVISLSKLEKEEAEASQRNWERYVKECVPMEGSQ